MLNTSYIYLNVQSSEQSAYTVNNHSTNRTSVEAKQLPTSAGNGMAICQIYMQVIFPMKQSCSCREKGQGPI